MRADYLCFGVLGLIFITSIPTLAERQTEQPNSNAESLVASEEGFRACPYKDPVGVPTIGFGFTFYPGGKKVSMADACLTKDAAKKLMDWHLKQAEQSVERLAKVSLSANQKTALTSFTFNVGEGALASSKLLSKLNAGDKSGAAAEFDRWTRGDGEVLPGLVDRRAKEKQLFLKP